MAPSAPTKFGATVGNTQLILSWKNPSEANYDSTLVRFSTSGYPVDQFQGTQAVNLAAAPGSFGFYVHSGLSNGTQYYYSAFAHDNTGSYSTANASAQDAAIPVGDIVVADTSGFITDYESGIGWGTQCRVMGVVDGPNTIQLIPTGRVS